MMTMIMMMMRRRRRMRMRMRIERKEGAEPTLNVSSRLMVCLSNR
jgi:hypothetical protein